MQNSLEKLPLIHEFIKVAFATRGGGSQLKVGFIFQSFSVMVNEMKVRKNDEVKGHIEGHLLTCDFKAARCFL